MSAYLANLMSKETNTFKEFIKDIEYISGCHKNDLKLSSDIKISTNYKLKALGLNPEDTTAPELYHSLNNLLQLHDEFIVKKIGAEYGSPIAGCLSKIVASYNNAENIQSIFSIKSLIIRKMLQSNKPIKTIQFLGYRSIASLLKHENPRTIISLALYVESSSWKATYLKQIKNLTANDFENTEVKFILLDSLKFKKISKYITDINGYNVIAIENIGQIIIVPFESELKVGFSILTYAYITYRLKTIIRLSSFTGNSRFNPNFGETLAKLLSDNDNVKFYVSKYDFSWDTLTDLFLSNKQPISDEGDDLLLDSKENNVDQLNKILINIEPALSFWFDSDNLGYIQDGKIVSLNLLDVCYNFYNSLSLNNSSHVFMEMSISRSLMNSYLESDVIRDQVQKQTADSSENDFMQMLNNRLVYS